MITFRSCVICKNFYVDLGYPGNTSCTPAVDAEISCKEGYWKMKNGGSAEEFRTNIAKAMMCGNYSLVTMKGNP
jgi:hypothetical protein